MPLQGRVHDIQQLHRKKTGWKVEQLYIHTYVYIYHIWRKSFSSKTCYICHGHEAQYLFEWVILNDHLQSSQGSRQLDHIFFRDLRSQFTLIEVFVQSNSTHGSLQARFRIGPTIVLQLFKSTKTSLQCMTWPNAMITSIWVFYKVIQEIVRTTLAAVS